MKGQKKFLSTPPSRVATLTPELTFPEVLTSFYPRHPRGWRRGTTCPVAVSSKVSIHATLAGGDYKDLDTGTTFRVTFLSTPPSRVATAVGSALLFPCGVSIHATLAGGDVASRNG